ncbi:MAG: heme-degrading domain-containing protein [Chloroflexi bacterium]|nr:heme-degrading domain-containing protein [Chloroflexota bacterium]OJV97590.1 MAG: hypothetical protein BGO39_07445 [Chloroflexi bacterium 54-19]
MENNAVDYNRLLDDLRQQETDLQFTHFTNDDAYTLGQLVIELARQDGLAITVDIIRHGQQLFHAARPGTSSDNDEWIKRKVRTVNRFGHSSFYMGIHYKRQNTTMAEKALLDPAEFAAHGGSFPIIIRNVGMVGTLTVSGLPQEEDHKLVVRAIRKFLEEN